MAGFVKFAASVNDNNCSERWSALRVRRREPHSLMELRGSHGRSELTSDDLRQSFQRLITLLAVTACSGGCAGPKAVRYTRMRYNEVMRDTNDEQLLMNIVRLRYADSPVFIDLPSITSQFEVSGRGNYLGGTGNQFRGKTNLGFGELSLRDTPTLSYHPREGRDIAKALLTPLSADLFIVVNAGADIEQLLLADHQRHQRRTERPRGDDSWPRRSPATMTGSAGESSSSLRSVSAKPPSWPSARMRSPRFRPTPIPKGSVQGRDLLNAARDGYVYRAGAKGKSPWSSGRRNCFSRSAPSTSTPPKCRKWEASSN